MSTIENPELRSLNYMIARETISVVPQETINCTIAATAATKLFQICLQACVCMAAYVKLQNRHIYRIVDVVFGEKRSPFTIRFANANLLCIRFSIKHVPLKECCQDYQIEEMKQKLKNLEVDYFICKSQGNEHTYDLYIHVDHTIWRRSFDSTPNGEKNNNEAIFLLPDLIKHSFHYLRRYCQPVN